MDEQEKEKDEIDKLQIWARNRHLAVTEVMCHVAKFIAHRSYHHQSLVHRCTREPELKRKRVRDELMLRLGTSENCRKMIHIGLTAFKKLCNLLKNEGGLLDTQRVPVEELVAKFLHILSNNARQRSTSSFFHSSREAISRHFHIVLRAIISLEDKYLQQSTGAQISPKILSNDRLYPFFKDCVGAIGGTHVRVRVSNEDSPRYSGIEGYPTIKVLAACSFDLKFTYVLPGWEGTASNSTVIKNALTREDKLQIPNGKYYLVNGGYTQRNGLLTPFGCVHYHFKEFFSRSPKDSHELFNLRHASLHIAIQRAFGVLKKRFPILKNTTEPNYSARVQSNIVLACCILHNFLMEEDPDDRLINEVDQEILNQFPGEEVEAPYLWSENDDDTQGEDLRSFIASSMWNGYQSKEHDHCYLSNL